MRLTARRLNRATLGRQLLLGRQPLDVVDAVRRVVALQAQEAASPYLALWNRLATFDPAGLDAAFADRAVVKATLMRITCTPSTPRTTRRSTTRCCPASVPRA
jgi:Winged helix DNA-binding domain